MRRSPVPLASAAPAKKAALGWLLAAAVVAVAGCSNSGTPSAPIVAANTSPTSAPSAAPVSTASPKPTATPLPTATPVPATPTPTSTLVATACSSVAGASTQSVAAGAAAMLSVTTASTALTESIAAGQIAAATTACLAYVPQTSLPAPLAAHRAANRRMPDFTAGAGNTYVAAFQVSFSGGQPSSGVSIAGPSLATIATGTQLNVAILSGGTWVDVGTALVGASGFTSTASTPTLPGVNTTGTYLVYLPAAGTNNTSINLGFALIADDGTASMDNGLQFVQLEDASGNALPTPTTTYFPVAGDDLDGQSLTPDAGHGAVVDGGSSVQFFSGIPQHTFAVSTNPVSVSAYGSDGDSIASLPNGDEVVVSADGEQPLAVISGILSGNPVIADSVDDNDAARDGLVLSNDGKVMLSRGGSGIDVYNVTPVAAHAGSTGVGTTSFAFALKTTLAAGSAGAVASPYLEDGRDGMAISPTDSSRAVVIGYDNNDNPTIQLLTGLTSSPTVQSIVAHVPNVRHRIDTIVRHPEPSAHRSPFALTPAVGSTLYAVTISQDGTTAFVSSNGGILTVSGVNTGNLAFVGSPYSPSVTVPGGTCPLEASPSIGTLPDGKYLAVVVSCGLTPGSTDATQGSGVILTIPIGAGGVLGNPVGQLNNVVVPNNDQIIFH